jgi:hypothetical protein
MSREPRAVEIRLYDMLPQFVSPHGVAAALQALANVVINVVITTP